MRIRKWPVGPLEAIRNRMRLSIIPCTLRIMILFLNKKKLKEKVNYFQLIQLILGDNKKTIK